MKRIIYTALASIAVLFAAGCDNDNKPSLDFSGDVEIRAFTLNGVEGVIDHQKATITVTLPLGVDVTSLAPQIEVASQASVEPASGQANNFSVTQPYSVTDKDVYRTYRVSVQQPRAMITRFTIGNSEGMIDELAKTIKVYVPMGTDLTSLIPVVEFTEGATITPVENSSVNFTNPVEYTLNYYETDFKYTVTVIRGMTLWNGEDVNHNNFWKGGNTPSLDIVDNPRPDGMNSTPKCMSILREKNNEPWSGVGFPDLDIDPAVYKKFSMMVLKDYSGNVQFEVQGDGPNDLINVNYETKDIGKWTEMIFELSEGNTFTKITQIVIAIHNQDMSGEGSYIDQRMYWDQIVAIPSN